MHGASITPQKSEDEKIFKKYGHARAEKGKKCEKDEGGVCHKQYWSQLNLLAKINLFVKQTFVSNTP